VEAEERNQLREKWLLIKEKWKYIVAVTLLVTFITAITNYRGIPLTYEASTSVIIGRSSTMAGEAIPYDAVMVYQKLVRTYMELAKSNLVLKRTAAQLGEGVSYTEIQPLVSATTLEGTQFVILKARGPSPRLAVFLAKIYVASFIAESQKVYPMAQIKVVDRPEYPKYAIKPKKFLNTVSAFLLSLIAAVLAILIQDSLKPALYTAKDIEEHLELPVLCIIPKEKR
jgi:capsular polysaccharide biosynthesis protein